MADNVTPIGGFSQAGAEKLREMAENGAVFAAYLKFHGRMFKHTPSVTLEFFVQHPESRFVATQSKWEKVGNPVIFLLSGHMITHLSAFCSCSFPCENKTKKTREH